MDILAKFFYTIDPVLISPYRWFENPMIGWWVGTFILAGWAVTLGEMTEAVAFYINRRQVAKNLEQTRYYHEQSLKAKAAGDDAAYEGINKLANDAFGKSFFLSMAMGMASLWPAFFAAAWLNNRFSEIFFVLPGWAGGFKLNFIAPFILLYIAARLLLVRLKPYLPFSKRVTKQTG